MNEFKTIKRYEKSKVFIFLPSYYTGISQHQGKIVITVHVNSGRGGISCAPTSYIYKLKSRLDYEENVADDPNSSEVITFFATSDFTWN